MIKTVGELRRIYGFLLLGRRVQTSTQRVFWISEVGVRFPGVLVNKGSAFLPNSTSVFFLSPHPPTLRRLRSAGVVAGWLKGQR